MGTSCKTPEHREGWTSCFLHDNAWDFFFSLEKKILIHMSSWKTPLVGLQPSDGTSNACGSCTDKKGFKKQWSFSNLLSMKLAILASAPGPTPQASRSLQPRLMLSEAWQRCTAVRGRAHPPSATDCLSSLWPRSPGWAVGMCPSYHQMPISTAWPHAWVSVTRTAAVCKSGFSWGSPALLPQDARNHHRCYGFPRLPVTGKEV